MKIIITNKQYKTLVENVTKTPAIDEGVGELVRSVLGRFSRKKSVAKNQINPQNSIAQELDADIRKKDTQFPNNQTDIDFMNTLLRIKATYEKIRLNAYLEPNDPNHININDANRAINSLIQYIATTYKKNLKGVYKGINNNRYKGGSRGAKLLRLADSMKHLSSSEIPKHNTNSVPRGTNNVPRNNNASTAKAPQNTTSIQKKQTNSTNSMNTTPTPKVVPVAKSSTKTTTPHVQLPKARPKSTVVQQPTQNKQTTINKGSTHVQLPKGYSGNVNKKGVNVQLPKTTTQPDVKTGKNVHVQMPNTPTTKKKGAHVQMPK